MSLFRYTLIVLSLFSHLAIAQHDHENTTLMGRWANGGYSGLGAKDSIAFVGTGALLRIIDYRNPEEPEELGTAILPKTFSGNIIPYDTILFVPMREYGLWIYDISDLTNPIQISIVEDIESYAFRINGQYLYEIHHYDGIYVYDISDPTDPTEVTFWETEGYPGDIAFDGNEAYLLDNGIGLVILDITNPEEPYEVGRFPIDLGAQRALETLAIRDSYVFIGDRGLRVLNVANQDSIFQVSYSNLERIKDIIVSDQYAFIYADDNPSGIYVLDIEDPYNLEIVLRPDTSVSHTQIVKNGDLIFGLGNGLSVYDVSEPEHPSLIARHQANGSSILYPIVSGDYLYCTNQGELLHIFDISDLSDPVRVGFLKINDAQMRRLSIQNDYLFIADYEFGMRIIDVSNPTEPTQIGVFEELDRSFEVAVNENVAYLISNRRGFSTIDISDPTEPVELDNYDYSNLNEFEMSGDIAYLAGGYDSVLLILDVSDPENIEQITTWQSDPVHSFSGISISNNYAYLNTSSRHTTHIVDISSPDRPVQVGHFDTEDYNISRSKVEGNYLYGDANQHGLRIIDISDHQNISEVGYYDTGGFVWGLATIDEYVFVGDGGDGLYIIRNDDPLNIVRENEKWDFPNQVMLLPNCPNPFNSSTVLSYYLPEPTDIVFNIYNISGQLISTFVDYHSTSGQYSWQWNAGNIPTGIYVINLEANNSVHSRAVTLIK